MESNTTLSIINKLATKVGQAEANLAIAQTQIEVKDEQLQTKDEQIKQLQAENKKLMDDVNNTKVNDKKEGKN